MGTIAPAWIVGDTFLKMPTLCSNTTRQQSASQSSPSMNGDGPDPTVQAWLGHHGLANRRLATMNGYVRGRSINITAVRSHMIRHWGIVRTGNLEEYVVLLNV